MFNYTQVPSKHLASMLEGLERRFSRECTEGLSSVPSTHIKSLTNACDSSPKDPSCLRMHCTHLHKSIHIYEN